MKNRARSVVRQISCKAPSRWATAGVELGYNIAQSIGYIALYGLLVDPKYITSAVSFLKTHEYFMYPNGAIDSSWSTRSFKWTLESGSKTAPGVYLTFGLLADKDPTFLRGQQLAMGYLQDHALDAQNWIVYGPHAYRHTTTNPPNIYSTFARAQAIATVIEYGTDATSVAAIPADGKNWFKYFHPARARESRPRESRPRESRPRESRPRESRPRESRTARTEVPSLEPQLVGTTH